MQSSMRQPQSVEVLHGVLYISFGELLATALQVSPCCRRWSI